MIKNAAKSLIKNPDSKVGTNYMASALLHFHCFPKDMEATGFHWIGNTGF